MRYYWDYCCFCRSTCRVVGFCNSFLVISRMVFRRVETRFEMLADQPSWVHPKGVGFKDFYLDTDIDGFPSGNSWAPEEWSSPKGTKKVFYHGTGSVLQPGDIIKPLSSPTSFIPLRDFGKKQPVNYAFATTNFARAVWYAAVDRNGGDLRSEGYIYQVKPVGNDWSRGGGERINYHVWRDDADMVTTEDFYEVWSPNAPEYISPSGWQVVKLVDIVVDGNLVSNGKSWDEVS